MKDIRKEAKSYYLNLFKEEAPRRLLLDGMEFDKISEVERKWIKISFSEDEVHLVIMSMKGDKSPS